jgi:MurNAc alpha-1-phosphate uridylyltransferase
MVLAAGLGVRVRPLTDKMPSRWCIVAGQPLLDYVLDKLAVAGVRGGRQRALSARQIIEHTRLRKKPRIIISDERDLVWHRRRRRKALPIRVMRRSSISTPTPWIDGVRPGWRGLRRHSTRALDILR